MAKLRSLLAYTWAVLATPIVLATFMGLPVFSRALAEGTGVKVSPWFVGGEVMREVEHAGYRTVLRRPVFEGLLGARSTGFVQVEWLPAKGASLPDALVEEIDYDGDGSVDFVVNLDTATNQAVIAPRVPRVIGLDRVYVLGGERVIRVALRRE
jgi:hypothetical protein